MNIFISGGCKNGKSMYAQEAAKKMAESGGRKLYYLATMIPVDKEDLARIDRHIEERRGWGFETVEQGIDILDALTKADPDGVFLLDSVTALLSNEMFNPADGSYNSDAGKKVAEELTEFAKRTGNTVFVSDYLYSDSKIFDDMTENYRRSLALVDKALAAVCDGVYEVAYGNVFSY